MKFSLITTTLGRTHELARMLKSVDAQTCRDFEVIVVDQNSKDLLDPILAPFHDRFPLTHIRSAKGASRGRNAGLARAQGDFITFPDDDCWYPQTLLENVATLFAVHPEWDGLSGRPGNTPRWSERPSRIDRWNVWKRAIEWTMFLRRELCEHVGTLNENIGPGAGSPYGAGEGTEYLIRALAMNFHLEYQPSIEVFHETPELEFQDHLEKSRRYAVGQGRVLRLGNYPAWYAAYHWMRPLGGAALGLAKRQPKRSLVSLAVVQGILSGYSTDVENAPIPATQPIKLSAARRQVSLQRAG
jgi:glycosyltransferase involved in cell wall biosynthesis